MLRARSDIDANAINSFVLLFLTACVLGNCFPVGCGWAILLPLYVPVGFCFGFCFGFSGFLWLPLLLGGVGFSFLTVFS